MYLDHYNNKESDGRMEKDGLILVLVFILNVRRRLRRGERRLK